MSKVIKQMDMDALKRTFQDVRDLVVLSVKGLNSLGEYTLRANLRKKKIRLQMVKNSLTRKVFSEIGMDFGADSPFWVNTTILAWGANSVAELSRAIDGELKDKKRANLYKDKVTIKGAVADGQAVSFDLALKMPTREEAISQILGLILSPGAQIAGCLIGPGGSVAGQIATLAEKKEEEAPAEGAPAEGAAAAS